MSMLAAKSIHTGIYEQRLLFLFGKGSSKLCFFAVMI